MAVSRLCKPSITQYVIKRLLGDTVAHTRLRGEVWYTWPRRYLRRARCCNNCSFNLHAVSCQLQDWGATLLFPGPKTPVTNRCCTWTMRTCHSLLVAPPRSGTWSMHLLDSSWCLSLEPTAARAQTERAADEPDNALSCAETPNSANALRTYVPSDAAVLSAMSSDSQLLVAITG